MDKKELLKQLQQEVYCRVRSSLIEGVGVFAVKKIPLGVCPFGHEQTNYIEVPRAELKNLHPQVLKLVEDFCYEDPDHIFYLPETGLQRIDISFLINHSLQPNLEIGTFKAKREIEEGEELTINYDEWENV